MNVSAMVPWSVHQTGASGSVAVDLDVHAVRSRLMARITDLLNPRRTFR